MKLDVKILGGNVYDGNGREAYVADVGIRDGVIVDVGRISTTSRRTINAGWRHVDARVCRFTHTLRWPDQLG